jgi:tetratricopeptide (TPR) repeat protein
MDTAVNGQATVESLRAEAVKLLKQGKHAEAALCIRQALAEAPEMSDLHNLLGSALASQGQHDESRVCFLRALELKPGCVEAHVNLGHHWRRLGQIEEALRHYREAIRIKPDWPDLYNSVGLILRAQGKLAEAESHFRQALAWQPLHSDSRNSLGVILADQGRWPEAEAVYQQVLRQQPKSSSTHNNLGVALLVQGKVPEAVECFQTALRLQPAFADALNNLGNAQMQAGQLEEAEKSLRRALELKPDLAEACNNLARVLVKQGKIDEAKVHFQQSVRLQPNYADAHKNLAGCLLLTGDFPQGWAEYEWHWRSSRKPRFAQPRWQGEPLAGRTVLLHAEPFPARPPDEGKARGDTLQFVRYADQLCAEGATVLVECQPALLPLLARSPGISQIVPCGQPLPPFDFHAPFLSLPAATHTNLQNVPSRIPYLFVDPERIEHWNKELGNLGKLRVGFAWQTDPQDAEERRNALPLPFFGRLAQIEGVRLVSLQRNLGKPTGKLFATWNAFDAGKNFAAPSAGGLKDVAAVMKNLDVAITPDIDLAHLAGGLGVTVWVLLAKVPDWRWLMERSDCPWYSSMRLFRQKEWGKWEDVFEQLAFELQRQPALEKPEFYLRTGRSLAAAGKLPEAVAALRRGLVLAPEDSVLHNDLGLALRRQEAKEEALACFERAVAIKPDNLDALFNLGNLLGEMERREEAEKVYRQGLAIQPNMPGMLNHLGLLLLWKAEHDEAEQCFRRAAHLMPDAPGPYLNNLGILLEQNNRLDEAVAVFQKVITCKESAPDAHKNMGMIHLVRGDFPRGWTEYEWRLKTNGRDRPFEQPRWDGQPLEGKPILIWTEQGLGDTIQFIRYAELVKQRGGYVILETRDILRPLLSRCPGIDQIVTQGRPLPAFACHAALLSLPLIFSTGEDTVPDNVPYLSAEPVRVAHWRRQLQEVGEFKIGIRWQGSRSFVNDRTRSIPLRHFEPLTRIPGVRLVSLQKDFGAEQLKEVSERWNVLDLSERLDPDGVAFLDTAAVIKNLDLVITSDTSMGHLAGALGMPVWVALQQGCDWRWLRGRDDTPWYPTMRLFRQNRWGDWGEIFERMAHELRIMPSLKLAAGPVLAEISPGDLFDKIAILEIKKDRVCNEKEMAQVQLKLGSLLATRARHIKPLAALDSLAVSLKKVNDAIWQAKDEMRRHEDDQDFGPRFMESARAVYAQTGERTRIKRKIDELLGPSFVAEFSCAQTKDQVEEVCSAKAPSLSDLSNEHEAMP